MSPVGRPLTQPLFAGGGSGLFQNLVEYWNLDEASGSRAGSHAGRNLSDSGSVGSDATGGPDGGRCAVIVAASTQYLYRANEAALQPGGSSYTWACWIRPTTLSGGAYRIYLDKWVVGGLDYVLYTFGAVITLEVGNGGSNSVSVNGPSLSVNTWYFVVCAWDAATQKASISVNLGAATESAAQAWASGAGTEAFKIGKDVYSSYADGKVAYYGFWKRLLTATEQTWLYNGGAGRTYAAVAAYGG